MIPGVEINIGGADYTVPPLTLGALEEFQDRLAKFNGSLDAESVNLVVDVTLRALKRNYPDMTRAALVDLLDVGNFLDVLTAVMDVSGVKRKEQATGKAAAADA